MVDTRNPQTEAVVLTERTCRYCRQPYKVPRGERRHACSACAPTLYDAIEAVVFERMQPPLPMPDVTDGIPF